MSAIVRRILRLGRRRLTGHQPTSLSPDLRQGEELFISHGSGEWNLHQRYQEPHEVFFDGPTIKFSVVARTKDEWAYVFLDPAHYKWDNYCWEARIRRETDFREFAFNFRYNDFGNRYRYRFEKGRLYFDKKVRAVWTNNIAAVPFHMDLGRSYDLRIWVWQSIFRCCVDGSMILENRDHDLPRGSICVVLWEDDARTNMVASVDGVRVTKVRI